MLAYISKLDSKGSRTVLLRSLLHDFTTLPAAQPRNSFLAHYLMSSLGFLKQEAISTSNKLPRLNPIKKDPDLVVKFFENLGLSKAHIKTIVSTLPQLLLCKVDITLKPKIRFLQDLGLSGPDLVKVIMGNKCILNRGLDSYIRPRIEFLRQLLVTDDKVVKALQRLPYLLGYNESETMKKNVRLLRSYGFSEKDVAKFIVRLPRTVLLSKPEWFQERLPRVESDLGIPRKSGMFYYGVEVICGYSKSTMDVKLGILKSFGFSDVDIGKMMRNNPYIIKNSEARLRKHLDFLLKELGYAPHYLADHLALFNVSLKRMQLRNEVLKSLKEKKLNKRKTSFYTVMCLTEQKFIQDYLLPCKDKIPDVYRSYVEGTRK